MNIAQPHGRILSLGVECGGHSACPAKLDTHYGVTLEAAKLSPPSPKSCYRPQSNREAGCHRPMETAPLK